MPSGFSAGALTRSVCLAPHCNLTENRGPGSETSSQIVDNRSNLPIRIASTKVGHQSRSFGDTKVGCGGRAS
jgi:hypothetical protein